MDASLTLSIASDLDAVGPVGEAVRTFCSRILDQEGADAVELSTVEAITNIIRHGYAGGPGRIDILVELRPDGVAVEIADRAPAMPRERLDTTSQDPFSFDATDLAAVPEGGMGLALIRLSMDEVFYHSTGGENRLRMVRRVR